MKSKSNKSKNKSIKGKLKKLNVKCMCTQSGLDTINFNYQ